MALRSGGAQHDLRLGYVVLVVALIGLALVQATHNRAGDTIASIVIGAILVLVAYAIGRDAKQLIGEAATAEDRKAIERALDRHPAVVAVSELLTMQLGPEAILRRRPARARGRPLHEVARMCHGRASAGRPSLGRHRAASVHRPDAHYPSSAGRGGGVGGRPTAPS